MNGTAHWPLAAFSASLLCVSVFTPVVIRLAHRFGALDNPRSSRKVHARPVPRLGGVAIVAAFFASTLGVLAAFLGGEFLAGEEGRRFLTLLAGGAIIAGLGVYDDLRNASATTKLAVQFSVAILVYALGFRIDAIANPFGDPIQLGWLGLPFTVLWIAGVTNAMNLIDGLDGLAGGIALVAVVATFLLGAHGGSVLTMLTCAALAGALLGFLRFNFNPARIFMGDSGSLFLGFVLATGAIATHGGSSGVSLLDPIVILGVPIADTLLAIGRRSLRGVPLFQPDRGHIHHRLLDLGFSHRGAVLVLYAAAGVLGAFALSLALASRDLAALLLAALGASVAVSLRSLGYLRVSALSELLQLRRRNLSRRAWLRSAADRLHGAPSIHHVWDTVKDAREALGAECVALRLYAGSAAGDRRTRHFELGAEDPGADVLRIRHRLSTSLHDNVVLELGWLRSTLIDGDTEMAVEQLCGAVQRALARIAMAPEAVPAGAFAPGEWRRAAATVPVVNSR